MSPARTALSVTFASTALQETFGTRYSIADWLTRYRDPHRGTFVVDFSQSTDQFVLHVQPERDFPNGALELKVTTTSTNLVAQTRKVFRPKGGSPLVLTLRERADQVLADMTLDTVFQVNTTEQALNVRLKMLEDTLRALQSLHRADAFHGDLRPSNIIHKGGDSWALVDWQSVVPAEALSPADRKLVVDPAEPLGPSAESDIYAFGRLAQQVLADYAWIARDAPDRVPALRSDYFEQVLAYSTALAPQIRPSTDALLRVLFAAKASTRDREFTRLRSHASTVWRDHPTIDWVARTATIGGPDGDLAVHMKQLPELRAESKLVQLAMEASTKGGIKFKHRRQPIDKAGLMELGIDDAWREDLSERHFGAAGDAGVPRPKRASFDAHVKAATEVRRGLLAQHDFYYTADVAALMSTDGTEVSPADVASYRRWGSVLAVQDHGRWLYPAFQFDRSGRPSPLIASVAASLGTSHDKWAELSWWSEGRSFLGGRSLASVLFTRAGTSGVDHALRALAS